MKASAFVFVCLCFAQRGKREGWEKRKGRREGHTWAEGCCCFLAERANKRRKREKMKEGGGNARVLLVVLAVKRNELLWGILCKKK